MEGVRKGLVSKAESSRIRVLLIGMCWVFLINQFLFLSYFLAVLGLHCCVGFSCFSRSGEWGLLSSVARGLPLAVAPHVTEHSL